jgi:TonB family protein
MHRRSDPRSPVQSVRDRSFLPFLLLILAAAGFAIWQDRDRLTDWYDGDVPDPVQGARPAKANLALLFSTDDYPMEAIRKEEQGTTSFRVEISRRGHVSDCIVTSSSGSDALDRATCDIVEGRALYEPARDAQGKRITGQDTGRIRWELPDE